MNVVVSIDKFIEDKDLREKYINRLEVLDKVKQIITLPNTELMTTKMVAEWYEVEFKTIQKLIERNLDELTENGMVFKKYGEIKTEVKTDNVSVLENIPRRGTYIFSKRALLNVGMLLRDSVIARRVRAALLDQQEELTDEQKVKGIEEEKLLALNVVFAETEDERMLALSKYREYKNRHIRQLEEELKRKQPMYDAWEQFLNSNGTYTFTEVAKMISTRVNKMHNMNISISPQALTDYLRSKGILSKKKSRGKYTNHPNKGYEEYFNVTDVPVENGNVSFHTTRTKVKPNGVQFIYELLKKENFQI
jgi:phage antirepressor YoqD-like protein